jgi:hypothetical protein
MEGKKMKERRGEPYQAGRQAVTPSMVRFLVRKGIKEGRRKGWGGGGGKEGNGRRVKKGRGVRKGVRE